MNCLYEADVTTMSALFGVLTVFDFCAAVWFLCAQLKLKGRGAVTRFSLLATTLPIGVGICTGATIVNGAEKICGIELNKIALAFAGLGLCVANFAYLCFIYLRSQALLSQKRKRVLMILVALTNSFMIAQSVGYSISYRGIVDNPNVTQVAIIATGGAITGVLALVTDISFFVVFTNHLRYMNLNPANWLILTSDDDAMRVIAKTGLRCSLTVLSAALLNIIAIVVDQYQQFFAYEVIFLLTMALLSSLGIHIMVMKFKVDQAQSRESSKATNADIGSTLNTVETRVSGKV